MSKIIICGLNGSGKTTLGRALSNRLNYLHKDVEMYYFNNDGEYKYSAARTKEEVTKLLEEDFRKNENIIFSACKGDYGSLSNQYDYAIYIKLDKETRLKRVKERSYKQFGDRILENGDLYESENNFFNMVYNRDETELENWVNSLSCDILELDGNKSVEENMIVAETWLKG